MSVASLISQDKRKDFQRKESLETVYSSNSRLSLLQKRKKLNPLSLAMSNQTLNSKGGDKYVTQRVLSAKTHRVKQLQNQLSDAHYHLQELSNENKVLRAMQKKHEVALQRYENSNAELPQVLNSHSEEMRAQSSRYKQVKAQYKEANQKLKEREMQLQQLRDEHQHLLNLSKDRNLPEREKLQSQVADLSLKVVQQNETISQLQRRIVLEAKNFRHQLQNEINKHKDTRNDLDMAITNADKLSTIIEMKEKMLSTVASRGPKSPNKYVVSSARPTTKHSRAQEVAKFDDRASGDQSVLARLAENSRNITSSLSQDDETSSSTEPRSRYAASRSRTDSNSTNTRSRKSSKGSDEITDIAKTIQDGMAELSIFDEEIDFKNSPPDEVQKKIEMMKKDFLHRLKTDEESLSRSSSALRKVSTEEPVEEDEDVVEEIERPKSRGRRTTFSDEVTVEETKSSVSFQNYKPGDEIERMKPKRESSNLERKLSAKPLENYCKDIMQNIEKSNRVIDKHMKDFNTTRFDSEKIVQQLQAVDKINEFVNFKGEIPEEALTELNNNFNMLTEQVTEAVPLRKRPVGSRRSSRADSKPNLFGDSSLSNKDLLDDLLGKK